MFEKFLYMSTGVFIMASVVYILDIILDKIDELKRYDCVLINEETGEEMVLIENEVESSINRKMRSFDIRKLGSGRYIALIRRHK